MKLSNEEMLKTLRTLYIKRSMDERKIKSLDGKEDEIPPIGLVENTPRKIVKIPFTYNIHDSLKSDEEIKKIAKKFNNKVNNALRNNDDLTFEIDLTLEKGASIYNIDEYFSRILSELKLPEQVKFRIVVNFGEKRLGKENVRYLLDKAESANLIKLQQVIEKSNGTLFFSELKESDVLWTLNEVIKANDAIHDLAKTIKENDLSPFEALLYICTWAKKIFNILARSRMN